MGTTTRSPVEVAAVEAFARLGVRWRHLLTTEPCVYCGGLSQRGNPMTSDHIVPRSRAGAPLGWENRAPACARCNNLRGSTGLLLYLVRRVHWGGSVGRPLSPVVLVGKRKVLKGVRRHFLGLSVTKAAKKRHPIPSLCPEVLQAPALRVTLGEGRIDYVCQN